MMKIAGCFRPQFRELGYFLRMESELRGGFARRTGPPSKPSHCPRLRAGLNPVNIDAVGPAILEIGRRREFGLSDSDGKKE